MRRIDGKSQPASPWQTPLQIDPQPVAGNETSQA